MDTNECAAKEAMAALDAMDEKLRRLGCDTVDDAEEGNATATATRQACRVALTPNAQYLSALQQAREARVRGRQEKRYHNLAINESCIEVDRMVEGGGAEQRDEGEQSGLAEAGVAQKLIHDETARAARRAHEAMHKSRERTYVSEQQAIMMSISANDRAPDGTPQPSSLTTRMPTDAELHPTASLPPAVSAASDPSTTEDETAAPEDMVSFCHTVSRSIIDLAIVVSDSRYLPAMDLAGQPVRRTAQDLAVSQWRQWTERFVFEPTRQSHVLCEHRQQAWAAPLRGYANEQPGLSGHALNEGGAQGDGSDTSAQDRASSAHAEEVVRFVAQQRSRLAFNATQRVLGDVAELLAEEGRRLRKIAVEDVRRRYDEQHSTLCSDGTGAATEGHAVRAASREDALPRWPQRLPPAGCLVFGDALSGTCLLCQAIEHAMQAHSQTSQRQSVTGDETNNANMALGSGGIMATKGTAAAKTNTTRPTDEAMARTPQSIGVALAEESGIRRILVTPRTLLGITTTASPARGHAGATGKVRGTGAGKMAAGTRLSAEEEERKEAELLIEALTRELVAVHVQNVCIACKWLDLLPLLNSAALSCVASSPRKGNAMPSKQEDKATPSDLVTTAAQDSETKLLLSCLVLIGFPESETFYQQLSHELAVAMEAAEAELATAQLRRQAELDTEDNATGAQRRRQDGAPHGTSRAAASIRARGDAAGKERGTKSSKVQSTLDDAATALAAQQSRQAIPPLSVLGYFLDYDQITRLRRMQGAYVSSDATASPSTATAITTTATTTLPQGGALAGGHAAAAAAPTTASKVAVRALPVASAILSGGSAGTLCHVVFHPEGSVAARGSAGASMSGSAAVAPSGRDGKAALQLQHRTGSTAVPSMTTVVAATSLTAAAGTTQASKQAVSLVAAKRRESVAEVWSTAELRQEMLTQEARGRHWRTAWGAACAPASGNNALKRFATAATLNVRDRQRRRSFARRAPSNAETVAPTGRRGSHAHISVEQLSDAERSCGKLSTEPFVFPRVLFFATTADVSDARRTHVVAAAAAVAASVEFATHATLTLFSDDSAIDAEKVASERAEYLSFILRDLLEATNPATPRLTNESLTVRQLQAPLRLSDHRLPSEVCAELLQTYQTYTSKLLPSSLWPAQERSAAHGIWTQPASHGKTHAPEMSTAPAPHAMPAVDGADDTLSSTAEMRAEIEVFRGFALFAASCLHLVSVEAFPASLWGPRDTVTGVCFTSTLHYTSIDQSYAKCVTELQESTAVMWNQLRLRCALLLRLAIDGCAASIAEMLDAVSEMVMRSYFTPRADTASLTDGEHLGESRCLSLVDLDGSINLHLDAPHASLSHTRKLSELRSAVKHSFSSSVRRLSMDDAAALVTSLTGEEGTSHTFWTDIACYIDEVERLATSVLLEFIEAATAEVQRCSTTMSDEAISQLRWSKLVPKLVRCMVARAFAPQRINSGDARRHSCEPETVSDATTMTRLQCTADVPASPHLVVQSAASMTLSPFLARCVLLIRHASTCFGEVARCSREWLEALYKLALTAPREGPSPMTRRPTRVAQLFSPPPTAVAATPTLARLPTGELNDGGEARYEEAFYDFCLASFAVCSGPLLSQADLLLCAVLAQLGRLCSAYEDRTAALFDLAHFTNPPPALPRCGITTNVCDVLPVALYGETLQAPCREPAQRPLPFLTLHELATLVDTFCGVQSAAAARTSTITAAQVVMQKPQQHSSAAWRVDAREFCLSMLAHRLCLCGRASTTLAHGNPQSCFPSAREIRQCMACLPCQVTSQTASMTAGGEAPMNRLQVYDEDGRCENVPQLHGNGLKWPNHHYALTAQTDEHESDDLGAVALQQWALWRTLCSRFLLVAYEVATRPWPSLPTVLKFLCVIPGSAETSVERMFHALAGIRHVCTVRRASAESAVVVADMDAVSALAVDQVGLSVDEFATFFAEMQRGGTPGVMPEAEQSRRPMGADEPCVQGISLEVDAEMLLQIEGRGAITLSSLLASHWGRALVAAHFA